MLRSQERNPLLTSSGTAVNANYGSTVLTHSRALDKCVTLSTKEKLHVYCGGSIVLLSVMLERISFYALTGNLYLFLNQRPMLWVSYDAMNAILILTGVTYVSSLFGGWIADSCLGRWKTIFISYIIYAGAYSIFPVIGQSVNKISPICLWNPSMKSLVPSSNTTIPTTMTPSDETAEKPCHLLIHILFVVIGIGCGSVRANVAPFGADQVKVAGPDSLRGFFNWFYWCVNIGAFVGIGAVVYIQQFEGFFYGYLIPSICLALSLFVFILGKPVYKCQPPCGSVITKILLILKEAIKSSSRHRARRTQNEESSSRNIVDSKPSWLDRAKVRYGGKFHEADVDDVRTLGTVLIVFIALIPYWILYFQMQTTFLDQGLHMRLSLLSPLTNTCNTTENFPNEAELFSIPAAWLTLFDVIFLIIMLPLMDRVIYPFLDRSGIQISLLNRMVLGMIFAALSMFLAGGLEFYRRTLVHQSQHNIICQVIGNTTFYAADLSVFCQVPQYALIGLSEVFASVAGMEFACSQAPRSMQGLIMGLFCFSTGIGSFLGTALLTSSKHFWLPSDKDVGDINYGQLDYYFFLLGGIQLISLLIFIYIAKKVKIKKRSSGTSKQDTLSSTCTTQDNTENIF